MTHLLYEGGPLSTKDTGTVYPLQPNQVCPLQIRKKEWVNIGHYVLADALTKPHLKWVPR